MNRKAHRLSRKTDIAACPKRSDGSAKATRARIEIASIHDIMPSRERAELEEL
jgi:hypothetical protein